MSDENEQAAIRITPEEIQQARPRAGLQNPLTAAPEPRTSQLAIVSLILGGIGLPLGGCMLGPPAILCGALALGRIQSEPRLGGFRLAVAGILLGLIGTVGWLVAFYWFLGRGTPLTGGTTAAPMQRISQSTVELDRAPAHIRQALLANVRIGSADRDGTRWVGSGVVIGRHGKTTVYVLTNRHVVDAATSGRRGSKLQVGWAVGGQTEASVLWQAEGAQDLSLLRTTHSDASGIPAMPMPRKANVAVGDAVFVVGNPLGFAGTYTTGVISAVRRTTHAGRRLRIYQTQAPISPGNSGGGLYTEKGQLIGLVTWSADKSRSEGLSFALSVESVWRLLDASAAPWLRHLEPVQRTPNKERPR